MGRLPSHFERITLTPYLSSGPWRNQCRDCPGYCTWLEAHEIHCSVDNGLPARNFFRGESITRTWFLFTWGANSCAPRVCSQWLSSTGRAQMEVGMVVLWSQVKYGSILFSLSVLHFLQLELGITLLFGVNREQQNPSLEERFEVGLESLPIPNEQLAYFTGRLQMSSCMMTCN